MANTITQQGNVLTPEWSGRWVSPRVPSPDVADPTDADAGRTDVSVDPARRTARTPGGRPLSVTASATATSPDCATADSPAAPTTTASATTPMPADGSGSRSRPGEPTHLSCDLRRHSSCCLRRRPRRQQTYPGSRSRGADAAPCVHLTTALTTLMSPKEPRFPADSGGSTHDAKLHFAEQVTQTLRSLT